MIVTDEMIAIAIVIEIETVIAIITIAVDVIGIAMDSTAARINCGRLL